MLKEIRIHDLDVAGARLDLAISGEGADVAVKVLRKEGEVRIIVLP